MIPFNRPAFEGREFDLISEALSRGTISGNGHFTAVAEAALADLHDGARTLLTTSCTHALEMSARLLDLQPGDEVIVPSYTFVSTASAFMWNGARPVFADSRPETLNIDPDDVRRLMTSRTRAICIVHYAGVGADPQDFAELAAEHGVTLIEDNAHGLGGNDRGRRLGTFGAMSALSFHETKNITCGEGGALVINDPALVERAEILREKGTDRSRFLRGQVDKYTWVDNGSSWVLSDLLAAVLVAQLERFNSIQKHRMQLWERYEAELADWAVVNGALLPEVPASAQHTAHMFHIRLDGIERRDAFIRHLKEQDILSVFHYQALHQSPMGVALKNTRACPVASQAAGTLVRLPLFNDMTHDQQSAVIAAARSFR
jgi:dTDP-4-amino-4,6-dideoxygalactose transaminase